MLRPLNIILSGALAAVMLLSGCGAEESAQAQTTAPATEALTEAPTEDPFSNLATADSVIDESKLKYDYLAIKQSVAEIEAALNGIIEKRRFKGVVYSKLGNDFEYLNACGFADESAHLKNSANTCFYTGSVTKQITAAAVLRLAEQKKLALTDPISKYFPDCAYAGKVTVKMLLTMTSGIPNYVDRDRIKALAPGLAEKISSNNSYEENKQAVLGWILSQAPRFEAGTQFGYSDSDYWLLGEVISQASGKSYEDYVRTELLEPLGMTKSGFAMTDALARQYNGDSHSRPLLYGGVGYSSLGFISNITDLLRWTDGLTDFKVISETSFGEMITDYGNGFGYGVWVNGDRVSSIGGVDAYSAKLSFSTDKSRVFAAFSNYDECDPNFIHRLYLNYLAIFRN